LQPNYLGPPIALEPRNPAANVTCDMSNGIDETRLIGEARSGNLDAFWQLVEEHGPMIRRLLFRLVGNRDLADDLFGETFVRAADRIEQFKGEAKFSTWLTAIAVNLAKNQMKREKKFPNLSWDDLIPKGARHHGELAPAITSWRDPHTLMEQEELSGLLHNALKSLPPKYRVVFALRDIEGLSSEETAEALNLSVTAVKSRAVRARLAMRKYLTPYVTADKGTPVRA
jgi:RNA polymerase sigma-70 factor (ECF subfamily)